VSAPFRGRYTAQLEGPFLYWRGVALVQYWRSFEQLEQFARSPAATHLEAWKRFNRAVGADGSVGIWHETVPSYANPSAP